MSFSSNHFFCYLASHCNNIIWQMPTYIITQDRSITCVVHYPNNFLLQIVCGVSDSISDWVRF